MVWNVILSAGVISLIGAVLAALLTVSERIFRNYGTCTITINGERTIETEGGGDLLAALVAEKIFIPSACGGRSTCGMCKVRVLEGSDMILPTEEPHLNAEERERGVRLSCQVKVRNDLRIEIPEELFSVREYRATVASITPQTHDIREFRFALEDPPEIDFIAGQYMQLVVPPYDGNSEEVYRAYSMSSDPANRSHVELVIRLVEGGLCTTYCFDHLEEGMPVRMNGPYGDFRLSETEAPMIFIAGGSGMAPMKSLLHQMVNEKIGRRCIYFFGANQVRDLFMGDVMKGFEEELPSFTYVPVVARPADDEEWSGETGLVTEAVERAFEDASDHEAYLCGSPGMIDAAIVVLKRLGVKEENIFYDKFA